MLRSSKTPTQSILSGARLVAAMNTRINLRVQSKDAHYVELGYRCSSMNASFDFGGQFACDSGIANRAAFAQDAFLKG